MTDWGLYVEDNVVVANFSDGMPSDAEEYTKVNEQFGEVETYNNEADALAWATE